MPIQQIVLIIVIGCVVIFYGLRPILSKLIECKRDSKKEKKEKEKDNKKED